MRLRLSQSVIAPPLRNVMFTPGRDFHFSYPAVELDFVDYALGTSIVGASLVITPDFGKDPIVVKTITATASADGQITNDGAATGIAGLYFALSAADTNALKGLGPLAFEVVVTDSLSRQGSLDEGSFIPRVSTAGAPVDHVIVAPLAFALEFPATQAMTATAYDKDGNALTGRVIVWSSSDETVGSVNSAGIVSVQGPGIVTITATIEGKSASAVGTLTGSVALELTLDWAPLRRRMDLTDPLTISPSEPVDGPAVTTTQTSRPLHSGCGTLGNSRCFYPKTADAWGAVVPSGGGMDRDAAPLVGWTFTGGATLTNQGPYKGTSCFFVDPKDSANHVAICNMVWRDPDATKDHQDYSTYKRSVAVALRAHAAGDVGKTVRVNLCDHADLDGLGGTWNPSVPVAKFVDVVLTADWQHIAVTANAQADFAGKQMDVAVTMGPPISTTPLANYDLAIYRSVVWQAEEPNDPSNWLRPLPWHETLGLTSSFQAQNSWGPDSDDPVLLFSAAKASTAVAAPDNDRYYGGRNLKQFTLGAGDGITTDQAYRVEDAVDFYPSNIPVGAAWLHWYIEPGLGALPADGALAGYLHHVPSNTDYGPVSLVRDAYAALRRANGGAFYRGRIKINQKRGTVISGTQSGANYIIDNGAPHGLVAGDRIAITGSSVAALNAPAVLTAVTTNTFTIVLTAANAGDGFWAQANLDFQPRIVNASGAPLLFNAYRAAMTAETQRSYGWHNAWVPKRTVTGPVYNDAAFEVIPSVVKDLSVLEGIYIARYVLPYGLTDLCNLNGNATDVDQGNRFSPCLFQSGPTGSADASFDCDLVPQPGNATMRLLINVARGSPCPNPQDFLSWTIIIDGIPVNAATLPAMVAFDIALAWHGGVPVAFGIGAGVGTPLTWLTNGSQIFGGTVTIQSQPGLAWEFDVIESDSHMGLAADRDTVRETGGWVQALAASKIVNPNPEAVRQQIQSHVVNRFGPRLSYR